MAAIANFNLAPGLIINQQAHLTWAVMQHLVLVPSEREHPLVEITTLFSVTTMPPNQVALFLWAAARLSETAQIFRLVKTQRMVLPATIRLALTRQTSLTRLILASIAIWTDLEVLAIPVMAPERVHCHIQAIKAPWVVILHLVQGADPTLGDLPLVQLGMAQKAGRTITIDTAINMKVIRAVM